MKRSQNCQQYENDKNIILNLYIIYESICIYFMKDHP